jgi:hypothetical protein
MALPFTVRRSAHRQTGHGDLLGRGPDRNGQTRLGYLPDDTMSTNPLPSAHENLETAVRNGGLGEDRVWLVGFVACAVCTEPQCS